MNFLSYVYYPCAFSSTRNIAQKNVGIKLRFSQLSGEVDGIHDGYPIMDLEEKTLTL